MNQWSYPKILLLAPPTGLTRSFGKIKNIVRRQASLGLAYIAAVLRDGGFSVSVLDAYIDDLSAEKTIEEIVNISPDILGISLLTSSASNIEKIIPSLRERLPSLKIVMGNMHASMFADDLLRHGLADYIVHREGEYTMLELVKAIQEGTVADSVAGISFLKSGNTVQHNPLRNFLQDLDALPYPAWDLFPLEKYHTDPRTMVERKKRNVQELMILATRGCPMQCTFCSSRAAKNLGNTYRMRRPKAVADEIAYFHKKYGVTSFSFMDLSFPLVKPHAMELCEEIISRGLQDKISWSVEMRVRPVDLEIFQKIKAAGCKKVCFGIESGSQEILNQIKKGFTLKDVREAVAMARSADLEVDGFFILGFPNETEEMSQETIRLAKELDLNWATFNLFVPYPGCELYDILMREEKIQYDDWSSFISYPSYGGGQPVYVPDGRNAKELITTQRKALRSFYLRPKFILSQIKKVRLRDFYYYWTGLKAIIFSKQT